MNRDEYFKVNQFGDWFYLNVFHLSKEHILFTKASYKLKKSIFLK